MKFPIISLFAFITSAAFTSTAIAEPYVGIGIGTAEYKVDLGADGDFEDNGTATKLYGGYAFNKYFAVEASVYNFAEASIGALETNPGSGNFVSAAASMKGVGAYAVGMYPVSKKVNLLVKLGMLSWDADIRVDNTTRTNDGTDAAYALAASYAFTKEFLATVEWETFDSDNPELSMLSLGFRFNFR